MKITFVLPYAGLAGGIRVVAIYAELLKLRGHEVTVVSVPMRTLTFRERLRYLRREKRWPSQVHSASHFDKLDVNHIVIDKYRPITNEDVPDGDTVIATWWETAEWVNQLDTSKGKKFYFVQHHETHSGLPIERVKATYLLPLHKITISKWLVDIMAKKYGDQNVAFVPNSVDFSFFSAEERGRQSVPTIGFMYSPAYYKGCDIIIEALKKVREEIPELRILAFGAKHPVQKIKLLPETEYFTSPTQEKIVKIYSSCDFWLFGSRFEGFGLPILEAMACCTPVIATKAGAAPEILERGGGRLVDDLDPLSLSRSIIELLDLPDDIWQILSQQAREIVTNYSWDNACDLFEQALSR